MTARRAPRTKATADIEVPDEPVIEVVSNTTDLTNDEAIEIVKDVVAASTNNRKYFSHANCDHPRKGEAGKAARAKCRAGIRSYLKAEAEWKESQEVAVAV